MEENNDSAMGEIKKLKDMKFMQSLFNLVKDTRDFSQDILLEEMLQNEGNEGLSDSINNLSSELKGGFKDLTYAIKQQKLTKENMEKPAIEASYVNLSEDSIKSLAVSQQREPIPTDDVDWNPMVSDSIIGMYDTQKEMRDLMVRQNTLPSTMTDLESVSGVYYQKSMYYLQTIKDVNEKMLAIAQGNSVQKGSSESMIEDSKEKKVEGEGIFDKMLSFLGVKGIWDFAKTWLSKFNGIVKKMLDPILGVVQTALGWVGKKIGSVFGWIIEKALGNKFIQKLMGTETFGFIVKNLMRFVEFLGPLGTFAAKLAKFIPGPGWLIAIGVGLFDAISGFKDADKIIGKAKDKLTLLDKVNAGLVGVLSGLTLGLIDKKKIYKGLKWFEDQIKGVWDSLMSLFPKAVKKGIDGIWKALFDPNKGVFGSLVQSFERVIDDLSNGNYMLALKDALMAPIRFFMSLGERVLGMLSDGFSSLVGKDNMSAAKDMMSSLIKKVTDVIMDVITSMLDILPGNLGKNVKEGVANAYDGVKSYGKQAMSWIGLGEEEKATVTSPTTGQQVQVKSAAASIPQSSVPNVVSKNTNAQKTVQMSQDKDQAKQQINVTAAPAQVNVTMPPQTPRVDRRQRAGSETILHMNSALGRP